MVTMAQDMQRQLSDIYHMDAAEVHKYYSEILPGIDAAAALELHAAFKSAVDKGLSAKAFGQYRKMLNKIKKGNNRNVYDG